MGPAFVCVGTFRLCRRLVVDEARTHEACDRSSDRCSSFSKGCVDGATPDGFERQASGTTDELKLINEAHPKAMIGPLATALRNSSTPLHEEEGARAFIEDELLPCSIWDDAMEMSLARRDHDDVVKLLLRSVDGR